MTKEEEKRLFENCCIPFSSGSDYMNWTCNNCDQCVKSYRGDRSNMDAVTTRKMIGRKLYCKLEYFLELGSILSDVPYEICQQIGIESEQQGSKDKHVSLKRTCMFFSDDENDRYKPPPRPKPDRESKRQLKMPLGLFEETPQLVTA